MQGQFVFAMLIVLVYGSHHSENSSGRDDWDIFVFSQEWPVAVCTAGREEHHRCVIPQNMSTWGIHGLWPSKTGTHGPTSCNSHTKFNSTVVQPLLPMLTVLWPNLYVDTGVDSFWEHEWYKHGTCASSLPATANEGLYFRKALEIGGKYSATTLLGESNIQPSDTKTYKWMDVMMALTRALGAKPLVQCTKDRKTDTQMLYEVEICLDKQFIPVDCLHSTQTSCPHSEPIAYPTLRTSGFQYPTIG